MAFVDGLMKSGYMFQLISGTGLLVSVLLLLNRFVPLALALFAVPRTEALSFSLLLHASQFFPITIVGLLYLLVEHVSLADATRGAVATPDR